MENNKVLGNRNRFINDLRNGNDNILGNKNKRVRDMRNGKATTFWETTKNAQTAEQRKPQQSHKRQ